MCVATSTSKILIWDLSCEIKRKSMKGFKNKFLVISCEDQFGIAISASKLAAEMITIAAQGLGAQTCSGWPFVFETLSRQLKLCKTPAKEAGKQFESRIFSLTEEPLPVHSTIMQFAVLVYKTPASLSKMKRIHCVIHTLPCHDNDRRCLNWQCLIGCNTF